MGPNTFTDKSTLQSLTHEEALWLNLYFRLNLTPILLVETLADLAQERLNAPDGMVRSLARKSTIRRGWLTAHHETIGQGELLGSDLTLDGRPIVLDEHAITTGNGKGVLLRRPAQVEAMDRWCHGAFKELERRWARDWRESLEALDLRAQARTPPDPPRTFPECQELATRMIDRDGARFATLRLAIERFRCDDRASVMRRWKEAGGPCLRTFAPFAAHVLTVDAFFGLALGAGLLSPDRPSNQTDIAYCYYLPFCQVFVSSDRLHRNVVPLFLREDQEFVPGLELKEDLSRLNAYYENQPESVHRAGAFRFARYPPTAGTFLTARIWDRCHPGWREQVDAPPEAVTPELKAAFAELIARHKNPDSVQTQPCLEAADVLVVQQDVPVQVGRWNLFAPEILAREKD